METFFKLSSSRPSGMSLGSIPISEICSYATFLGHIEETLEEFVDIILSMDSAFLEHHNKESQKKSTQPKKK